MARSPERGASHRVSERRRTVRRPGEMSLAHFGAPGPADARQKWLRGAGVDSPAAGPEHSQGCGDDNLRRQPRCEPGVSIRSQFIFSETHGFWRIHEHDSFPERPLVVDEPSPGNMSFIWFFRTRHKIRNSFLLWPEPCSRANSIYIPRWQTRQNFLQ